MKDKSIFDELCPNCINLTDDEVLTAASARLFRELYRQFMTGTFQNSIYSEANKEYRHVYLLHICSKIEDLWHLGRLRLPQIVPKKTNIFIVFLEHYK